MIKITHYDLFAGIGGFSLALDTVFNNAEIKHIFCEKEEFPTAVLKRHWPQATYYGDIRYLVTDTNCTRRERFSTKDEGRLRQPGRKVQDKEQGMVILTGGFPCQPFSQAGRRKGTADDRYLWPLMFETIKNIKPDWIIAENVRGFVTWNDGMVLETVCSDLEGEGYEVQPIIIPAVAVGAPHRRDRVWIIAHSTSERQRTGGCDREGGHVLHDEKRSPEKSEPERDGRERRTGETGEVHSIARHSDGDGLAGRSTEIDTAEGREQTLGDAPGRFEPDWERDWREVALATCHDGMDDGLPRRMGGTTISSSRHRKEQLKAYGNAIVPQVAMQVFQGIKNSITHDQTP